MYGLGDPLHRMTIIGFEKILGFIALLAPGAPPIKEWAYAGFTFNLTGATASHLFVEDPVGEFAAPIALLLLAQVKEELEDQCAIAGEMALEVPDGSITLFPHLDRIARQLLGQALVLGEDLGMNTDHQHFLIVGAIEDSDSTPLGQLFACSPEKVVVELFVAWLLERMDRDAMHIHAGHDVANGAIFPCCVHGLEDEQNTVPVVGVHHALQLVDTIPDFRELLSVGLLVFVEVGDLVRHFRETYGFLSGGAEWRGVDFFGHGIWGCGDEP